MELQPLYHTTQSIDRSLRWRDAAKHIQKDDQYQAPHFNLVSH